MKTWPVTARFEQQQRGYASVQAANTGIEGMEEFGPLNAWVAVGAGIAIHGLMVARLTALGCLAYSEGRLNLSGLPSLELLRLVTWEDELE